MIKTVLVVDDSACVRHMIRRVLETEIECDVFLEAKNGEESIQQMERLSPDLAVIDFSLPGLNGLEITRILKRKRPEMPIVLFTLFKDPVLERDALTAGASIVLAKEDGMAMLCSSARRLLTQHSS